MFKFILFADDTTILYSHDNLKNRITAINNELKEITNWFKANKLSVNAKKTNFMIMGTRQRNRNNDKDISIVLNDAQLDRVSSTKFLGVIIDENLTWKNHIDGVSKTISRNIGVINKLKYFVPERILYSLYCTLVLPYINYSILIWGNTYQSYLEKIFKLQKWAVRAITSSHYRCHSAPLFQKLKILNVFDTYKLEAGIFMFKHFNNHLPIAFNQFFSKHNELHEYFTRCNNDYTLTKNRLVFSDQTIKTSGPIIWKSLDSRIKDSKSLKHFKNQLKCHLLLKY